MYSITGDEDYKTAFENIWWSICLFDRHNTGGFSSGESATGNPDDTRAIETCCTVAWMALSVDMLRLTEDPYVADELELATWNGLMGAQNATGRSFTYNTPMMGVKKASSHDIVFGVGGMAMIAAPAVTKYVGTGGFYDALEISNRMMEIAIDHNGQFPIPNWDFKGICCGIDARKVAMMGIPPVINTGIAHRKAGLGQIGAGTVTPPMECFRKALVAYAVRLGFK